MSTITIKASINVFDTGNVEVEFQGGHVNKRELLRMIKALKNEHRNSIRNYRKKLNLEKGNENGNRTNSEGNEQRTSKTTDRPVEGNARATEVRVNSEQEYGIESTAKTTTLS